MASTIIVFVLLASTALGLVASPHARKAPSDVLADGPDFNVTSALEDYGITIDRIPGLEGYSSAPDVEKRSSLPGCQAACTTLKFFYGSSVDREPASSYTRFVKSFWSGIQGSVAPSCIFTPSNAAELSVLVLLSRLTQCPFAARGGGHAAFAGASNIEGGITVSLARFDEVTLSKDEKTVAVGGGNVWGTVYETLEPHNLTAIGGRLYDVGVGGLTLGGGVSYFSNSYGWACDNVDSYDIVLASGIAVRASRTLFPDLYWALRGGGNNFGIVYRFNMRTVPLANGGSMWAGSRTYTEDRFPAVFDAFANMIARTAEDLKANFYLVWVYYGGSKLAVPALWHEDLDGGRSPAFAEWNAIPAVDDTMMTRNVVQWGKETIDAGPKGVRQVFYMITVKANDAVHRFAVERFFEKAIAHSPGIDGFSGNIVTQGINVPQMKQMQRNGGNALGLDPAEGDLYIVQVCISWHKKEDDEAVYGMASDILKATKAESIRLDASSDFVYMNYASRYQNVLSTYGAANTARLRSIAEKYDPQQVFQERQPGHFKLGRAPVPSPEFFSH